MEERQNYDHLVEAIKWVVREEQDKLRADWRIELRHLREQLGKISEQLGKISEQMEKIPRRNGPQTLQAFFIQNPVLGFVFAAFILYMANFAGVDIGKLWR